ncbi:MAG: pilus assembly protein PilM [Phycisphaerae bacterium]
MRFKMAKIPLEISKFLPKKDRLIGLDMGSYSIKLAELAHQQGKLVLLKLKLQEIDSRKDNQDGQLDALKNLFRDINTQDARINMVINCSLSCTKISFIPFMPKSEILQALKWEMRNFISFPIDQAVMDYEILQEIGEGGVKKLKVAVACCPQETVDRYLDLLNPAGIGPSLFTQHGFALRNVITNLCSEEHKTVALLDIGHNLSELLIFQDRELAFSRKLPVAGQDFTLEMTQVLASEHGKTELSLEEAESIKKKYGIPSSEYSEILEDKMTSVQLVSLLRPNLEKLVTEIERSFAYYREKEQGAPVELLILLGGGSNLKNLTKNLSESLRVPVQFGNPVAAFPLSGPSLLNDEPETVIRFASALGAALASSRDINLLPIEIKQQTKLLIKRSSIKALITAVVMILILLYTGMSLSLSTYDKRIAAVELQLRALSTQIEEVPNQIFLQSVLNQRIYLSDGLKEISNLVPEQICLTEMNAREKVLTLKGQIKSLGLAREKVLTEFMRSLEKGIFKEVNLISTKDSSQDKLNTFELRSGVE